MTIAKHLSVLLLAITQFAQANIPPNYRLPANDYIRGTWSEPLFTHEATVGGRLNLRIQNEWRFCEYRTYWDSWGNRKDFEDISYSRLTGFFGIDLGLTDHLDIGGRIPYLRMHFEREDWFGYDLTVSSAGVGDLLLRFRVSPFGSQNRPIRMTLCAGVKCPTGDFQRDNFPTGTGSWDFPFVLYGTWNQGVLEVDADIGYVVTGRTEHPINWSLNYGDVVFFDVAVVRRLATPVSAVVELSGYSATSPRTGGGLEVTPGQYRLTASPGIILTLPGANVGIEGAVSYDLLGRNALGGVAPVLRLMVNRQL